LSAPVSKDGQFEKYVGIGKQKRNKIVGQMKAAEREYISQQKKITPIFTET